MLTLRIDSEFKHYLNTVPTILRLSRNAAIAKDFIDAFYNLHSGFIGMT